MAGLTQHPREIQTRYRFETKQRKKLLAIPLKKAKQTASNGLPNEIFLVNRQCLARVRTARCTASLWLLASLECRMLSRTRAPVHDMFFWSTNRDLRVRRHGHEYRSVFIALVTFTKLNSHQISHETWNQCIRSWTLLPFIPFFESSHHAWSIATNRLCKILS